MTEQNDVPIALESDGERGAAAELAETFKELWGRADADGLEGRRTMTAIRGLLDFGLISRIEAAPDADVIEALCEAFHDAYERAAVGAGWETQERSRKPWAEVPEANKAAMRSTIQQLIDAHVVVVPR